MVEPLTTETVAPCPFCGGKAVEGPMWPKHYGCSDSECGAYMANLALDKWNQRVPEMGWFLKWNAVNNLQSESIKQLMARAKHAHYIDVLVRIDGKDQHFEADWLKHLEWHQ